MNEYVGRNPYGEFVTLVSSRRFFLGFGLFDVVKESQNQPQWLISKQVEKAGQFE
jgi:hypothetical protein